MILVWYLNTTNNQISEDCEKEKKIIVAALSFFYLLNQGRRKLPKSGGLSSYGGGAHNLPTLVEIGLMYLPKTGWSIAHPSPMPLSVSSIIW